MQMLILICLWSIAIMGEQLHLMKRISDSLKSDTMMKAVALSMLENVGRGDIVSLSTARIRFEALNPNLPEEIFVFVKVRLSDSADWTSRNSIDGPWEKTVLLKGSSIIVQLPYFAWYDFGSGKDIFGHLLVAAVGGKHIQDGSFITFSDAELSLHQEFDQEWISEAPWIYQDFTPDYYYEGIPMSDKKKKKYKDISDCEKPGRFQSVYSVKLSDVTEGEQIRAFSEATISRCNRKDLKGLSNQAFTSPCYNDERNRKDKFLWEADEAGYYDPWLFGCIYVTGPNEFKQGFPISNEKCIYDKHHCILTAEEAVFTAEEPGDFWVHLNVAASSIGEGNVQPGHVMEVENSKGFISAVRGGISLGIDEESYRQGTTFHAFHKPEDATSETYDPIWYYILTKPARDVHNGDILLTTGKFTVEMNLQTSECTPLVLVRLVVGGQHFVPGTQVQDYDMLEHMGILTGQNCPYHKSECDYEKVSTHRITSSENQRYVSIIAAAFRTCLENGLPHEMIVTSSQLTSEIIRGN